MPDLDGFELASMIRQHPRFQRTAIIFISAVHLTDLDRIKGYEHGAVTIYPSRSFQNFCGRRLAYFAELHRKTRQLEALIKNLSSGCGADPGTGDKSGSFEGLNFELAQKNMELDAIVHTAPDIIFSRQPSGIRDYLSDRFYEYTALRRARRLAWAGGITCTPTTGIEVSSVGWNVSNRARITKWNIACAAKMATIAGSAPAPCQSEIVIGKVIKWYGTCSDIHDSKLVEHSFRDNAAELEKIIDERQPHCSVFSPPDDRAG